jgi:hypothetical protein
MRVPGGFGAGCDQASRLEGRTGNGDCVVSTPWDEMPASARSDGKEIAMGSASGEQVSSQAGGHADPLACTYCPLVSESLHASLH